MAQGKKSFIAYADWKDTFDNLPNEVAGKLIKHIFAYVNDENPNSDDFVINAVFANIKNALKRDLDKWENQLEQRREAGKKSAEQRALTKINERSNSFNENERNSTDSVNVNDNVNVSVSDNVNVILLEKETKRNIFSFKKKMIDYGFEEKLVSEWLLIRKNKKATNTQTAFEQFIKEIETRPSNINDVLKIIVTNSWSGFKYTWIDNIKNDSNAKSGNTKSTGNTNAEQKQSAIDAVNALYGR